MTRRSHVLLSLPLFYILAPFHLLQLDRAPLYLLQLDRASLHLLQLDWRSTITKP